MFDDLWWTNLQERSKWILCHEVYNLRQLLKLISQNFYDGYNDGIKGILPMSENEEYLKGHYKGNEIFRMDNVK